jgi:hypothetical protein
VPIARVISTNWRSSGCTGWPCATTPRCCASWPPEPCNPRSHQAPDRAHRRRRRARGHATRRGRGHHRHRRLLSRSPQLAPDAHEVPLQSEERASRDHPGRRPDWTTRRRAGRDVSSWTVCGRRACRTSRGPPGNARNNPCRRQAVQLSRAAPAGRSAAASRRRAPAPRTAACRRARGRRGGARHAPAWRGFCPVRPGLWQPIINGEIDGGADTSS